MTANHFVGLLRAFALVALVSSHPTLAAEKSMNAQAIAPGGTLRAAINLGNPVLAGRDNGGGDPIGISVDIARELGRQIGRPVQLVTFNQAGEVSDAASKDQWDVAFLAIDPKRAEEISFTAPYVLIEGAYAVPSDSSLKSVADVDRDGVRIAVIAKSAYDLFLTRTLKHATLVRGADDAATVDLFRTGKLDALAGVRQPLTAYVAQHTDMRVIPGRFMAIEQAMGVPHAHAAAIDGIKAFVEDLKTSGFIAKALSDHNQPGAEVAPAAAGR